MSKTLRTSGDYTITAGDGWNSGSGSNTITLDSLNVSVSGNLTVGGSSTTVSTTNTTIEDNIIELNTGASANTNSAGIIIERGTAGNNAAIIWKEDTDSFVIGTTTATAADKSSAISVTAGALTTGAITATSGSFSTTLSVTGTSTFSDGVTAESLITNEIVSNGSNAAITVASSGTGDATIDAGGDIILDADNADIKLKDGGTEFGRISRITSDLVIKSMGDNNDIILKGLDDSATINALQLDMSAGGAAIFSAGGTFGGNVTATSLTTNTIASNGSNAELSIQPSGTGDVLISALRINGTTLDSSDSTKITIAEAVDITGNTSLGGTLGVTGTTTLSGSFQKAVHTFTGDDAITSVEHAGRLLLLGEVGGNANVTLTLPDATGSGDMYEFVVTVHMASNDYKIQCPDADNTITGQVQYLDEDGTAVTSYPTVAASDTITLNGGTQGGLVGDTLTLIDIAADKWMVKGLMRVSAGANPSTPFTAAVS